MKSQTRRLSRSSQWGRREEETQESVAAFEIIIGKPSKSQWVTCWGKSHYDSSSVKSLCLHTDKTARRGYALF